MNRFRCHSRNLFLCTLAISTATSARAQIDEDLLLGQRSGGAVWAQSLLPKLTVGSASMSFLDMGPPGPPISGLQSAWLEWTPDHVWIGSLGTVALSQEVTEPPGMGGLPIQNCLGAATFRGGWTLTSFGGSPFTVHPDVGAFLWTSTKLYLVSYGFNAGTGISVTEVKGPALLPIPNVLGVAVIDSFIVDESLNPLVVTPRITASAFVYTPTNAYHIQVTQNSTSNGWLLNDLQAPGGGSIASTRGVDVLASGPDPLAIPPAQSLSASLLWNPGHLYLVTQTTVIPVVTEIFNPTTLAPLNGCWGVANLGSSSFNPARAAAHVWQRDHAWIFRLDPGPSMLEATQAPGSPLSPPIVSNVNVAAAGVPLVERQASMLYEIIGTMLIGGMPSRTLILGQNQRDF